MNEQKRWHITGGHASQYVLHWAAGSWNSDFRVHTTSVLFALLQPPFYSRDTAEMYENILYKPLRLRTNVSPAGRNILEEVRLGLLITLWCGNLEHSIIFMACLCGYVLSLPSVPCQMTLYGFFFHYFSGSRKNNNCDYSDSVMRYVCVLSFNPSH